MNGVRTIFVGALFLSAARALPAQDMPLSQVLIDGESWELVSQGHAFTEGPAADAAGNVYFTDVRDSKIYKIDLSGEVSLFAQETARTNGLMFGPDGRLFGCRNGDRQIVVYRPDGTYEVLAGDVDSNDLAVTAAGGVYFSDPKGGRVWYVPPGGKKRVVADGLKPNGVILWPDGQTLVVTDRDHPWLWAFRVEADGSLTFPEEYYGPLRLSAQRKTPGSDGMAVDRFGRLYVATAAGLQMFDPTGRMGGVILKPQNKALSNVAFGGKNRNVLYVTCTDRVYRRRTKTQGVSWKGVAAE